VNFSQFLDAARLHVDQDNLRMKFSVLNVDFSSPIPEPLGSRRQHRRASKTAIPLKSGYLPLLAHAA